MIRLDRIRPPEDCFAATANRGRKHVGHAEDVEAREKRSIVIHSRAHHVGKVDCVRDVGMLLTDGQPIGKSPTSIARASNWVPPAAARKSAIARVSGK